MTAKAAIIISLIALFIALGSVFSSINVNDLTGTDKTNSIANTNVPIDTGSDNFLNSTIVTVYVPAVDNEGNGVKTKLTVETIPGRGRILTNINNLLFWVDTQQSIQIAKNVAEQESGIDMSKMDIIYTIETEATVIEGPSAGAALTIATIAALQNKPLNDSVMMTGTINSDGTIGPVGGILAKAKVAKDLGAALFLVPEGQGLQTNYVPKQTCEKRGSFTFCVTEYVKQTVDTTKDIGIQVIEVATVQDALNYMLAK
ncbi:MAG TPA: S16 family serine protease [archaeon]|nr:S16 family serine protease [archaeon]